LERDPQKIEEDFLQGMITKEKAKIRYGVVLKMKNQSRENLAIEEKVAESEKYLSISYGKRKNIKHQNGSAPQRETCGIWG